MDLQEALLKEHSIGQTMKIADYIGPDEVLFKDLMEIFLGDDIKLAQRAAWVVCHAVKRNSWMIEPYLREIILNLQKDIHVAVKRNTTSILQEVKIPEDMEGLMTDLCFDFMNSGKETIAVKANCMTILFNITRKYPELKEELKLAVEDLLPYGSPGIKSRGQKILKQLKSI